MASSGCKLTSLRWCWSCRKRLDAFKPAYDALQGQVKLLLTTYFDSVGHNLDTVRTLPVQGLHVDLVAGHDDIAALSAALPNDWLLSLGSSTAATSGAPI